MAIIIWDGNATFGVGMTPFGLYDSDTNFALDSIKVSVFCANKLGYPLVDVELQSGSFFTCFEESVTEYSSQVNQFNMRDNMLLLQGTSTGSNVSQREIVPNIGRVVRISKAYGNEVGVGGNVDWKSGSINISESVQNYDLNVLFRDVKEPNKNIEIKRVFHNAAPAIARYFDPFAGTGIGTYNTLQEFGFSGFSPATSYMMMPMFADILRFQAIELNDLVRRSAFSFQIVNNKLKIFPLPTYNYTLYFEYIVIEDRDNVLNNSRSGVISDYSNVPYNNISYSNINHVGKQWIRLYTLALSKELLGNIRSKYSTVPIPGSELTLDGDKLRTEGKEEKEKLITQLRENLEETSRMKQMEKEKAISDNLKDSLRNVPLPIYIG